MKKKGNWNKWSRKPKKAPEVFSNQQPLFEQTITTKKERKPKLNLAEQCELECQKFWKGQSYYKKWLKENGEQIKTMLLQGAKQGAPSATFLVKEEDFYITEMWLGENGFNNYLWGRKPVLNRVMIEFVVYFHRVNAAGSVFNSSFPMPQNIK